MHLFLETQIFTYKVTGISVANVKGGTGIYSFNNADGEWNLTNASDASYIYNVKQSSTKVENKSIIH